MRFVRVLPRNRWVRIGAVVAALVGAAAAVYFGGPDWSDVGDAFRAVEWEWLVVAIGVGIPLAPLTILWGAQFGFAIDWVTFWRASVDIWLVGHGVDVRVTLDPTIAASLGFVGADQPFAITIAALGNG